MKRLVFILLLFSILYAKAPSAEDRAHQIKISESDYWWGESFDTVKAAKQEPVRNALKDRALAELTNSIRSFVISNIELQDNESGRHSTSTISKSVSISSAQYLQSVRYLEYTANKRYYVLAYLSKEDFRRTEDEAVAKLMSILNGALQKRREQSPGYFEQLLTAYLYAQGITRVLEYEGRELSAWLYSQLQQEMEGIVLEARVLPSGTRKSYPVEIKATNLSCANSLLYTIPELGFKELKMIEGKIDVFYEALPSRRKMEVMITITPDLSAVSADPVLAMTARAMRLSVNKKIALDFSSYIDVDFEYEVNGSAVKCIPRFKGISLAGTIWDFGDGNSQKGTDQAVQHEYLKAGLYTITMQVNDDIMVQKTVSVHGKFVPKDSPVLPEKKVSIEHTALPVVNIDASTKALQITELQELEASLAYLEDAKKRGILVWGRLDRKADIEGAWVLIFDPQTKKRLACLQPVGQGHLEFGGDKKVPNIFDTYRGKIGFYVRLVEESNQ